MFSHKIIWIIAGLMGLLLLNQTLAQRSSRVFDKLFYNSTTIGDELGVIMNINQSYCNFLCVTMKDRCVLSQWSHHDFNNVPFISNRFINNYNSYIQEEGVGECRLFRNVTTFFYHAHSEMMTTMISQFAISVTYTCTRQVNRFYYDLKWARANNVTNQDACDQLCLIDQDCIVSTFDARSLFCLTSHREESAIIDWDVNAEKKSTTNSWNMTIYANYVGMTSSNCSFDANKSLNIRKNIINDDILD